MAGGGENFLGIKWKKVAFRHNTHLLVRNQVKV
jgi:hypothetical protein